MTINELEKTIREKEQWLATMKKYLKKQRTGVTCNKCKHCANAKAGDKWAVYAH